MPWDAASAETTISGADVPNPTITIPINREGIPKWRAVAAAPQEDCSGAWQVCSPQTVPGFSAVGYFFGRELRKELEGNAELRARLEAIRLKTGRGSQ